MYGKPLNKIRDWARAGSVFVDQMLKCWFCSAWWAGLIVAFWTGSDWFLLSLASCGFVGILGKITDIVLEIDIQLKK